MSLLSRLGAVNALSAGGSTFSRSNFLSTSIHHYVIYVSYITSSHPSYVLFQNTASCLNHETSLQHYHQFASFYILTMEVVILHAALTLGGEGLWEKSLSH